MKMRCPENEYLRILMVNQTKFHNKLDTFDAKRTWGTLILFSFVSYTIVVITMNRIIVFYHNGKIYEFTYDKLDQWFDGSLNYDYCIDDGSNGNDKWRSMREKYWYARDINANIFTNPRVDVEKVCSTFRW